MAQGQNVINALIIPLSSASAPPRPSPGPTPPGQPPRPDNTLPGAQPGIDNTLPGAQPGIDNTLPGDIPRPSHPIYYPLPPGAPVDPNYGIPVPPGEEGGPPRPSQGPGFPTHPIVLPPGGNGGWLPVYIDNTLPGDIPHPDHELPQPEGGPKVEWKAMWTPSTGWVSFAIVVPSADTPRPTPSAARRR